MACEAALDRARRARHRMKPMPCVEQAPAGGSFWRAYTKVRGPVVRRSLKTVTVRMNTKIRDYVPLLREAIEEARAAGLDVAASELEQAVDAVVTTSSEMFQLHGLAIERFLGATRDTLPWPVKSKLRACLAETQLAGTGWRKLMALVKMRKSLG